MQTGLGIMWATILADALMNWKYLSLAGDDLAIYLMGTVGIFSLLLFLSIGVLLFSQINGLNENVTTLESFIPGIEAHVSSLLRRQFSKKRIGTRILKRCLGNLIGYCPLPLIYSKYPLPELNSLTRYSPARIIVLLSCHLPFNDNAYQSTLGIFDY
jgi:hypothetical protein